MPQPPIADLHCDLLLYLAGKQGRDLNNLEARCALPQLKAGNVFLQTLAIYTKTERGSAAFGSKQVALFNELPSKGVKRLEKLVIPDDEELHVVAAIENASAICEEDEDIDLAFKRLKRFQKEAGPLLYLSFTHNEANRFAGGNQSKEGLKKDGEALLDALHNTGIAIDLSHTSDKTAEGIFKRIDEKRLNVMPIASHSNLRKICSHKRNLPDEFAQEIAGRGGVIGLNLFKQFVGDGFVAQLDHARKLGILDAFCMGADFFFEGDVMPSGLKHLHSLYYEEFGDASCYPRLFKLLSEAFSKEELEGLAYKNLAHYFERIQQ